ncbi:AsmA-like C-terminal region-containing protein [Roseibium sp.]|uniref:AsmA-like C-terminal region-containing protein n=1 Tax=Roseibium sp. TaxID=1936156 RepID=UPI003B52E32B
MAAEHRAKRRTFLKVVRRVLIGLGALIVIAGAVFTAVLTLDMFLPLRQAVAGQILTSQLDRNTQVKGAVAFDLGRVVTVRIEDAVVERLSTNDGSPGRFFEFVRFDSPYQLFLGDVSQIFNFKMAGADIEIAETAGRSAGRGSEYFQLPSDIINMPVFDTLKLSDVTFHYIGEAVGWDETLQIQTLQIAPAATAGELAIVFEAVLNGTPLKISGEIARPPDGGPLKAGRFDLNLQFPGLSTKVSGTIDTSTEVAGVEGRVEWVSPSLSEALASAGITSELDGTINASWQFSGTLDALTISHIDIAFVGQHEDRVRVSGAIENASIDPVLDLAFDASLVPLAHPDNELAIDVLGLSGEVRGPLNGLAVDNAQLKTSAAILDIETIGPITVGRVAKQDDGRISLEELVIKDGPPDKPHLVLSGQVADVIGLTGITLTGNFQFPVALLLEPNVSPKPDLGTLEGVIEISDAASWLGLETLQGSVVGTDLLDLSFALTVPELRHVDKLAFSTELKIPDPAELLRSGLIEPDRELPAILFTGESSLDAGQLGLVGALASGSSQIEADLSMGFQSQENVWLLQGDISSDAIDLSEISGLADFVELGLAGPKDAVSLTDGIASNVKVDVGVAAKSLVSGKKEAGNISANVHFENDILKVANLSMAYIGGLVKGDFGVDFTQDAARGFAKGRMEKFPLRSLMTELGLAAPITSTVYASFDLSGAMGSERDLLRTLTGKLTTSLWGGHFPDRIVELSGLSAFTWLVSGSGDKRAKLVCAVLPLRFKSGRASGNALVVETANVQIVGGGSIDFRNGALNLAFLPRAKKKQLVQIVSPFEIKGTLKSPELIVKEAGAGRAVGEVLSLPLNLLGHMFRGSGAIDEKARPCVIPKNTKPK